MAKAHCCDQCGKLIKESDIHINLDGFSVLQNRENNEMPKGFSIEHPEDFCSFTCLSEWALEQQKLLDTLLYRDCRKELWGGDERWQDRTSR